MVGDSRYSISEGNKERVTHHFPRIVMTTQSLPDSSVSLSTKVEKQMALIMPSPNFSLIMAL